MEKFQLIIRDISLDVELISFEGELAEVSVNQTLDAEIGDFVTCIYHGKYLEARVINLKNSKLYLFIPQHSSDLTHDRRSHPRLTNKLTAMLINESEILQVIVENFNTRGFGLTSQNEVAASEESFHLIIQSEILTISPQIEIVNSTPTAAGFRYGSVIKFIKNEELNKLRSYFMFCRMYLK